LLDRAAELDATDPGEAQRVRDLARTVGHEHAEKAIRAGRFTRAASIISQSVEGVMYSFDRIIEEKFGGEKTVTPEERARVEEVARQAEEALAKVAKIEKERAAMKRKIKRLEDELAGKRKTRKKTNIATRKKLAETVRAEHKAEIDAARERLLKKFGLTPGLKSVLPVDMPVLTAFAQSAIESTPDLTAVRLIGSQAANGVGNDTDLLLEFDAKLPAATGDAEEAVERLLEAADADFDIPGRDIFVLADGRYFHLSTGAGRMMIENTEYGTEQAGKPSITLASATPALKSALPSRFDEQTLSDLAEVGALLLTDGIAREAPYMPEDFEAEMRAEFGDIFGDEFDAVYRRSWAQRDKWLNDMRQKAQQDKIRAEYGEELEDWEVDEIIGERKEQARARRAVETIHRVTATREPERADSLDQFIDEIAEGDVADAAKRLAKGKKADVEGPALLQAVETLNAAKKAQRAARFKPADAESNPIVARLRQLKDEIRNANRDSRKAAAEEIRTLTGKIISVERLLDRLANGRKPDQKLNAVIAELAKSPEQAQAATLLAAGTDPHDIAVGLGLESAADYRKMLRDAQSLVERAKAERAARNKEMQNDVLRAKGDLRDIEDLRFIARNEVRQANQHVADEIARVKNGDARYYLSKLVDASNAMRTMMASFDLSGALRQGGFLAVAMPEQQKAMFRNMIASLSEKGYGRVVQEIEEHALFAEAQRMGIDFAMAGKLEGLGGEELFRGEEFIESIPLLGKLVGKGITRPSERTYTAFLDTQRMVTYALFSEELKARGLTTIRNKSEFKKLADFINVTTGRGVMPSAKFARILLDLPLFAPRYTLSRLQLLNMTLNPVAYRNMPPNARKIIARTSARFYGTTMAALLLASVFGAVNWDDDDDDFLKISVGNTKYDIFAGTLQPAKVIIKLFHSAIRTKGGLDNRLSGELAWDTIGAIGRYLRGKLSPVASLAVDYGLEADYVGNQFSWPRAVASRLIPLTFSEMYQAYQSEGGTGMVKTLPSIVGIGVANYPPRAERPESEAEKLAAKINAWRFTPKPRTPEEKQAQESLQQLRARARQGDGAAITEAGAMRSAGTITDDQFETVANAAKDTYLQSKVRTLSWDEMERVYEAATATERAVLDPIFDKKIQNARKNRKITDADIKRITELRKGP